MSLSHRPELTSGLRDKDLPYDRDAHVVHPLETYWRPIAGSQLYLVANTIANYNIRYVESQTTPEALIVDLLGEDVVITRLPRENTNM